MSFSRAEFEAAVDKINQGMDDMSAKMEQIPQVANSTIDHWYIPSFVAEGIIWLAEKMMELAQKIWDKLVEVLKGVAAPVTFFFNAQDLDGAAASAQGVAANFADGQLVSRMEWSGAAALAYKDEVATQRNAATELGVIADQMAKSLVWAAVAGLLFYVGLGVIVVKFVIAMVAAIAALGSVVFSWAGAALIAEEAGVNIAAIAGLVSTLLLLLGDQVKEMLALQAAATTDKFPHGAWPKAST